MSQETSTQQQKAKHLAARAVMAYRAGFPIEELSISTKDAPRMGIVCNWKELRAAYDDDSKLLRRGLAFVYIGTIIDQEAVAPPSEELREEVLADQSSALEARQTAVNGVWHSGDRYRSVCSWRIQVGVPPASQRSITRRVSSARTLCC